MTTSKMFRIQAQSCRNSARASRDPAEQARLERAALDNERAAEKLEREEQAAEVLALPDCEQDY